MKKFLLGLLIIMLQSTAWCQPATVNASPCTIYFASGLFSAREQAFNISVTNLLENQYHYRVFLPQRDGFEFTNLNAALTKYLPKDQITKTQELIIYYLDMGYFIVNSQAMVAILDEDLDPGVLVEITYGNILNKIVIGLRTDSRSPFGQKPEEGAHFFSILQLDAFIYFDDVIKNIQQADREDDIIAAMIDKAVKKSNACSKPLDTQISHRLAQKVITGAKILFHDLDIKKLNTPESLEIIVKRYLDNQEQLEQIFPSTQRIQISMLNEAKQKSQE